MPKIVLFSMRHKFLCNIFVLSFMQENGGLYRSMEFRKIIMQPSWIKKTPQNRSPSFQPAISQKYWTFLVIPYDCSGGLLMCQALVQLLMCTLYSIQIPCIDYGVEPDHDTFQSFPGIQMNDQITLWFGWNKADFIIRLSILKCT